MEAKTNSSHGHAIVIGGGIAGLLAARVLSDFYGGVTIIEKDRLYNDHEPRRGVPQGRHAHGLLAGGLRVVEDLFPGISQELIDGGAVPADPLNDGTWFFEGGCLKRKPSDTTAIMMSRPFFESVVRRRVRALANISFVENSPVRELLCRDGRVTGIRTDLAPIIADLVVDASGRGSNVPRWLASLGFDAPTDERINVHLTYTTRLFRRDPQASGDKFAVIPPTPAGKRGGVVLAQEDNRWIVTLFGHFGNEARPDLPGFLAYAKSLPSSIIYDKIRNAVPLDEGTMMRFPTSIRHRYERLNRFPKGFLVFGDAICSFNPVYGQGMSVAALQAKTLREELAEANPEFAMRFFEKAAAVIDNPWNIAVGGDLRMPETNVRRGIGVRLMNYYLSMLHRHAHRDAEAASAFLRVAQLIDSPSSLMSPKIALRVLLGNLLPRRIGVPKQKISATTCEPMPSMDTSVG